MGKVTYDSVLHLIVSPWIIALHIRDPLSSTPSVGFVSLEMHTEVMADMAIPICLHSWHSQPWHVGPDSLNSLLRWSDNHVVPGVTIGSPPT